MWKKKLESKSDIVSILDGVSHRNTLSPAQEKYFPYRPKTVTQQSVHATTVHMICSHSLFLSFENSKFQHRVYLSTLWSQQSRKKPKNLKESY